MREIIINSRKKMDEVKLYSSDIYEDNNNNKNIQKNLIKLNDDINITK